METKSKHFFTMSAFIAMLLCISLSVFTSCGDNSDDSINTSLTLNVGETHSIGQGDDWESANTLVASVKNGTIKAVCSGTTTITGSAGTIKVTVKATNYNFIEPYLSFGASKSNVKKAMSAYSLIYEDTDAIGYDGKGNIVSYLYILKNDQLYISNFVVKRAYVETDDLTTFLTERYVVVNVDEEENLISMIDPLQKTFVFVQPKVQSSQVVVSVGYAKYTESTTNAIKKMKATVKPQNENNKEVKAVFAQLKDKLVK